MSGLWLILSMAVFGHRGQRSKKTSVGTLLCLMCLFIISFASLPEAQEVSLQQNKSCQLDEFLTEDGICCNKCSRGFKLVEKCHAPKERSNCTHCPDGQYTDQMNYFHNCRQCKICKASKHEIEGSSCSRYENTKCLCEDGYYKYKIDSATYECRKCKKCKENEVERRTCRADNNTVCGCKDDYYKVNGTCEQCKSCSSECSSLCIRPTRVFDDVTKPPVNPERNVFSIFAGIGAVIIVLLVLVIFLTYMLTKRHTKKRLLRSSQRSDTSQESCEQVLVNSEEHLETSVKEFPQSSVVEVEVSKLPDCVPLEIKLSELIYTVLDLVPVMQVKQLVRFLGVTDTEIEQTESDYRSCREAHYQMLRVWASRSGGGGRGGMLHRPLLKELLEKLRMMHLEKAAEELETKYGIQ